MKTYTQVFAVGETSISLGMGNLTIPLSIQLTSSHATRKIELSTDGGSNFFIPQIDVTNANYLVVTVTVPITNIKVTGIATNVLKISY